MRFLLGHSRWMLGFSMLSGLLSGLGGVALIALVNLALEQGPDATATLAWMFVGLCVLLLLARAISVWLLVQLGQNAILQLRLALSRRILATPLARLQTLGPARLLACLTDDVTALADACRWLPALCVNSAVIAGCLLYLGWLSGVLLGLVALTIALGVASFNLINGRALRGLSVAREYDDALFGHLRSLTQGIKELQLHQERRAAFLKDCLESTAMHYRHHYLLGMFYLILAGNWGHGLFYVLIGIGLFAVPDLQACADALLTQAGVLEAGQSAWQAATPQTLRGYCLTILYMMSPMAMLVEGVPVFGRASIALKKIQALSVESGERSGFAEVEPYAGRAPGDGHAPAAPLPLTLRGVTHRYYAGQDERCFTLGPLDLTIAPGELVFLVGGNGSGKTTLALLLVGLYLPERGEIHLGGQTVGAHNREHYRQQFSTVFSDFYLFDSLLGLHQRELDGAARAYLAHLQLDHKVSIENGVFSTLDLSQGQRKRLALLVTYCENRPFYLFDEWAADQDPVFKTDIPHPSMPNRHKVWHSDFP